MPPKPFPYPISIGVDLCLIPRMRRLIRQRDGRNIIPLAKKIFHRDAELGVFQKRLDTYRCEAEDDIELSEKVSAAFDRSLDKFSRWMAGRFDVPCNCPSIVFGRLLGFCRYHVDMSCIDIGGPQKRLLLKHILSVGFS